MILDERMITFINSLDRGNTPFLEELEKEARRDGVPVIRRETQIFLKVWLAATSPHRILEVGTAVGFSALFMRQYGPADAEIVTIENNRERIRAAKNNIRRSGNENRITVLEGDAADVLKTLSTPFDFIFMDAAKGQYIHFLPDIRRLMHTGSTLASDNVLQGGDLIESHFIVERRNRTIYKRMRDYLQALEEDPGLVTSVIPLGDGIAVSVDRGAEEKEKNLC